MAVVESNTSHEPVPTPIEKWAAIAGRWTFSERQVKYTGPEKPEDPFPLGLALSSERFRDGRLATRIKLQRNERIAAGIFFGYESLNSPYLSAQIGGFDRAFSISEYRPGRGWFQLAGVGTISNLDVAQTHSLSVELKGQTVRMMVDGVDDVLEPVLLPQPIIGTRIGLYAWGDAENQFSDTKIERFDPRIFVSMPFAEPYDTLYHEVIAPVAQRERFKPVRVDEIPRPVRILDDIEQQIKESHAIVAEISTNNPNVFYELGYAHALKKPTVLLARTDKKFKKRKSPFNISGFREIRYKNNIGGTKKIERNLTSYLKALRKDT